jgi:hypothetical protein
LDVGGKKMDWALDHQAPQAKVSTVTALHLCASENKTQSAKFLLSEGESLWRKSSMMDNNYMKKIITNGQLYEKIQLISYSSVINLLFFGN